MASQARILEAARGEFVEMDAAAITRELRERVSGLELRGSVFRANHASNWLPISIRLWRMS